MVDVTPPERRTRLRLGSGRVLAWSEWGPVDGRPVVFCTGAGMSGALGLGADVLAALEMRLLAIDRPGLGGSDPHPTTTLDTWTADVAALIASQASREVTAIGFSQGAPFALALAGRGLARAVAIVSGQDELSHPRMTPMLHPDVQGLVRAAAADPAALEDRFAAIATADVMWQLVLGMSAECDRTLYGADAFAAAYRQALDEGFAQGARGYARDLVNALGPWLVAPEAIGVPVDLWYGALDTSTVHSPDLGATLAARLPRATRTVDPDAGSSLLWTRAHDILAGLRAHGA